MNINAQFPGATHDSFIWRQSQAHRTMEEWFNEGDPNTWLLGDSGYPQLPWLMTPVLNAVPGSAEHNYNTAHASARNCIERCIGVLKTRFRCLLSERVLRYDPVKAGNITVTCAVLHNMCLSRGIPAEENVPYDNHNEENLPNIINDNNLGRQSRAVLIHRYFN